MAKRIRLGSTLPLAAIGLATMLGGCVVYPAYPAHPAYGYGGPYYGGYVGFGGGWHDGGWRR